LLCTQIHEDVVKKAKPWIDDAPPSRALHYRQVLRQTPFTKGGFPRVNAKGGSPFNKKKKGKKKRGSPDLLPARRTESTLGDSQSYQGDLEKSGVGLPTPGRGTPSWALQEEEGEGGGGYDDDFEEE